MSDNNEEEYDEDDIILCGILRADEDKEVHVPLITEEETKGTFQVFACNEAVYRVYAKDEIILDVDVYDSQYSLYDEKHILLSIRDIIIFGEDKDILVKGLKGYVESYMKENM